MNRIYFDDNLKVLKTLANESIDLIYIDPPFNTKKTQKRTTIKTVRDDQGDRKGFKGNTYRTIKLGEKAYEDRFDSYIDEFLRPRLEEAHRILKPTGSLYFHIDYREVHYCKILLDDIFGRDSFLNEIIWAYDYGGRARTKWPAKHDNILLYVKDPQQYIFNGKDVDKEPYMAPGLVGEEKSRQGKMPTDTWWPMFAGTDKTRTPSDTWWFHFASEQSSEFILRGQPKGQSDVWWQTIVPTGSKERLGYPTQKPRKLIDRIIKASSHEGATVLDFFAGSGTVGESCLALSRNFILIDKNKAALEVMAKRFSNVTNIEWKKFNPIPFQSAIMTNEHQIQPAKPQKTNLSDEFIMLAAVANFLQEDLLEDVNDLWKNSPFEWILKLPPRKKGKLGGDLIASWLSSKGIQFESTKDSSETLSVNNVRFANKFSTLWTNGTYRFQQIRSKGYDYVICLGISPFAAHCWVFEKKYAIEHSKPQHKSGRTVDYWMEINPNQPTEWASKCGGTLEQAYRIIKKLKKN